MKVKVTDGKREREDKAIITRTKKGKISKTRVGVIKHLTKVSEETRRNASL